MFLQASVILSSEGRGVGAWSEGTWMVRHPPDQTHHRPSSSWIRQGTVNEQSARILLECILVSLLLSVPLGSYSLR